MTLFRRGAKPPGGFFIILCNALTLDVPHAKVVLRVRMALFRRGSEPPDSLFIVLRDALTVAISHAKVVLFLRVSPLSCDPRFSDGIDLSHTY
jgi:hypothetical protein